MKKFLIVSLAISALIVSGIAIAGVSDPGIQDTPHDIPVFYSLSVSEPCAFCHTPHVPGTSAPTYPLWNRSQGSVTYTMYTSSTFDMWTSDTKTDSQLEGATRACLTCHNGAVSELLNYPGRGVNKIAANTDYNLSASSLGNLADLGSDLRQEHPVSFVYDPTQDAASDNNGFPNPVAGKVDTNLPLYSYAGSNNIMACSTCHEPHDQFMYSGKSQNAGGTQVFFLRNTNTYGQVGNAGSALCKVCHVNKY